MHICRIGLVVAAAAALITSTANAQIFGQVGPLGFDVVTNFEDFQSYVDFEDPGAPFSSPNGFDFDLTGGIFVIWGKGGGVGFDTRSLYQNGGATGMTEIRMTDGSDIQSIEFQVSNGFGPADPHNVWVRAYNDGLPTGFDFDFSGMPSAAVITIWSFDKVFDEIRVQSYGATAIGHDELQFGAASIDNVTVGTPIPAPGVLALFALAGLASRRRRR